jgi:hypothetical protein
VISKMSRFCITQEMAIEAWSMHLMPCKYSRRWKRAGSLGSEKKLEIPSDLDRPLKKIAINSMQFSRSCQTRPWDWFRR